MTRLVQFTSVMTICCLGLGCQGSLMGERYRNAVDPSWPERYNHVARMETLAPFQVQAQNGTYLDQTVWNYHFEPNTDKLTAAGIERLDYLARKRPAPDGKIYLQTARDVGYDQNDSTKLASTRSDLDQKRAVSVNRYLNAITAGRNVSFEVQIHDPADPSFGAQFVGNAIRGLPSAYSSSLMNSGVAAGGVGGAAGGGAGAGGGGAGGGR
jgi:hypothetical protein